MKKILIVLALLLGACSESGYKFQPDVEVEADSSKGSSRCGVVIHYESSFWGTMRRSKAIGHYCLEDD